MKNNNFHLNESQIISAVVDQKDLPAEIRQHLWACSLCQEKKARFESELHHLGQMTDSFAPLPRKKLRLPLSSPVAIREPDRCPWNRHPVFVTGIVVVLLFIISSWMITTEQRFSTAEIIREMEEDQRLMAEIQSLEENILPEVYTDIAGESAGYFDEEFLDFVVPVEDNRNSV